MKSGKIHKIDIRTSVRLKKILSFLERCGGQGATGLEIWRECDALNPATYISHLRANGYDIECRYAGKSVTGASVYRYFLLGQLSSEVEVRTP